MSFFILLKLGRDIEITAKQLLEDTLTPLNHYKECLNSLRLTLNDQNDPFCPFS